jgi:intracellular sulfur oxidation DsrE/DsrF family protein
MSSDRIAASDVAGSLQRNRPAQLIPRQVKAFACRNNNRRDDAPNRQFHAFASSVTAGIVLAHAEAGEDEWPKQRN